MSLMKMRERQKQSPAAEEFRKPPSRGRAILFAVLAVATCAVAIKIFIAGNTLFAALLVALSALPFALSYDQWRRLKSRQDKV